MQAASEEGGLEVLSPLALHTLTQWMHEYGVEREDIMETLAIVITTLTAKNSPSSHVSSFLPSDSVVFAQLQFGSQPHRTAAPIDEETRQQFRQMVQRLDLDDSSCSSPSSVSSNGVVGCCSVGVSSSSSTVRHRYRSSTSSDRSWFFGVLDQLADKEIIKQPNMAESNAPTRTNSQTEERMEEDEEEVDETAVTPPISPPAKRGQVPTSAITSANNSSDKRSASVPMSFTPSGVLFTPDPLTALSLGGFPRVMPTPGGFMSPAPNTVLSFLSPTPNHMATPQSDDLDSSMSEARGGPMMDDQVHSPTSPHIQLNLSFGSADETPVTSAEKAQPPPNRYACSAMPPLHPSHGQTHTDGLLAAPLNPILCTPSTPPTKIGNNRTKRQPPAAGSRADSDLPHISTGASRRRSVCLAGGRRSPDGSAPIPTKSRVQPSKLSALLVSPSASPPLGPIYPSSAPFPPSQPHPIDGDLLQLALEGESSLMQALNSAAKKGRLARRMLDSCTIDQDEKTPPRPIPNGPGHGHTMSLMLPTRTLSAPSPLQPLTSPMICRSAAVRQTAWATRILPGLYLGNARHAADLTQLHRHRVSHIINAADDVPNYHADKFKYKNLHVADMGLDRGIRRVFQDVHAFVLKSGFELTPADELTPGQPFTPPGPIETNHHIDPNTNEANQPDAGLDASGAAASESSLPTSTTILVHCRKGANRSVTIVLALLMLLYPDWSLDQAHTHLLASQHYHTCPFQDNRQELLAFERQRTGRNTMVDRDFLTRFASE